MTIDDVLGGTLIAAVLAGPAYAAAAGYGCAVTDIPITELGGAKEMFLQYPGLSLGGMGVLESMQDRSLDEKIEGIAEVTAALTKLYGICFVGGWIYGQLEELMGY